MGLNRKQKEQAKEALEFIRNNDILEMRKNGTIHTDNPFVLDTLRSLDTFEGNGFSDLSGMLQWSRNRLAFLVSEQASHNFRSPDPY